MTMSAGEMKAFRRHGQGEYIWNSGKTYNGEWIKGKEVRQFLLILLNNFYFNYFF